MIDEQNFSDQPVKNDKRKDDNNKKTATGHYTTGVLLDYPYFKEHCNLNKLIASKQQVLDVDPKAIQQINFTGN